jgi:DMSO/TMAO reductase YedYZ molybdopterin-dependent catalytic subunit
MNRLSRREYLALTLAANALAGKRQLGGSPTISVQDFEQYPALLTPASDLFVRNHFATPALDSGAWSLRIGGRLSGERTFSLAELRGQKQRAAASLLECAGNGVGVGAVGCGNWEGVPLGQVLRTCGIAPDVKYVRLTGADRGREADGPVVPYSRCLALDDAMRPETLVALSLNGVPLEPDHGYPARAIVPGRYGMDSVKWLERIDLLAAPDDSFYMTQRFRRVRSAVVGEPVGPIQVKSIIVKPAQNAALRGQALEVGGYAWAGVHAIQSVDIRVDGGPWTPAHLLSAAPPLAWVAWRFSARLEAPGVHTVESRATSRGGEVQPEQRDPARDDEYELNHVQRVGFFSRP